MRGAAGAPAKIRSHALRRVEHVERVGFDVGVPGAFADRGDLQLRDENAFAAIEQTIDGSLAEANSRLFGGITRSHTQSQGLGEALLGPDHRPFRCASRFV